MPLKVIILNIHCSSREATDTMATVIQDTEIDHSLLCYRAWAYSSLSNWNVERIQAIVSIRLKQINRSIVHEQIQR
jgi:hypothetical protein